MSKSKNVVLITGGSRGIGRVIATHLSSKGYHVFATSRQTGHPLPENVHGVALDVQDDQSVSNCIGEVIQQAGRVDVLINNAGFDLYGALEETSLDEFKEQMDTNLMGAVRMVKAVLPHMRSQGMGRIINVSSLGGRIGLPMNSAYAASKFALEGLSESLRLELLPMNIKVSVVVPGAVATDTLDTSIREVSAGMQAYAGRRQSMVKKMRSDGTASSVKPQDVANAVERLLLDANAPFSATVGLQAAMVPKMKALLPQRIFESVLKGLFP